MVTERPCIRCQHPVLLEGGHLTYCSYCGAPQIFLSDELQEEIAQQTQEYNQRSVPQPLPVASPEGPPARGQLFSRSRGEGAGQQAWPLAVQYALLSGGITLGLGLLTLLFSPVGILMLLWVIAAPILTVGFYNARSAALAPPSAGFAARLGLLTGLLVAVCCAAVFTLSLVLTRFVLHDAAPLDSQLAASFAQQRVIALQRMGAGAQPTLDMFAIPEFRVGLLLTMTATSAALYLFLSTVAAGLAGAVLQRRRNV